MCGPGRSKCMSTLLPILALALALAAALLSKQPADSPPDSGRAAASIWAVAVTLILFLAAFVWQGWNSDATHVAIGLAAGALAAVMCRWVPPGARVIASLGLAAGCEGFVLWAPAEWKLMAQLGAIAGAALASWVIDVRSKPLVSTSVLPVALAAVVSVDLLGGKSQTGDGFAVSGTLLAMVACAAGVLGMLSTMRGARAVYQQAIAIGLLGLGAFIIGWRYLDMREAWMLVVAGMVVGLVVNWLMDDNDSDALRPLIAAILWIGLATIGFGLLKGYGMALGFIGGAASLLLVGNVRALLSMGPLAGLVMYRVFREEHVAATRALDIGQHYALIGLAAGALMPLMPVEWLRTRLSATGGRVPAAGVLWVVLLTAVPVAAALVLGPKGVVGFVAGLGFASLLESIRGAEMGRLVVPRLQTLSLGLGLASATTFIFQFLGDNTQLTREEKTAILTPLAIGILVVVAVLLILSPKPKMKEVTAS